MINEIIYFVQNLPTVFQVILGLLVLGVIFSLIKKFIKFAIYLAIFAILMVVLYKLLVM